MAPSLSFDWDEPESDEEKLRDEGGAIEMMVYLWLIMVYFYFKKVRAIWSLSLQEFPVNNYLVIASGLPSHG